MELWTWRWHGGRWAAFCPSTYPCHGTMLGFSVGPPPGNTWTLCSLLLVSSQCPWMLRMCPGAVTWLHRRDQNTSPWDPHIPHAWLDCSSGDSAQLLESHGIYWGEREGGGHSTQLCPRRPDHATLSRIKSSMAEGKHDTKVFAYYLFPNQGNNIFLSQKDFVPFLQHVNRDQWKEIGCFVPINGIYTASFPPGINSAFD